MEKAQDAQDTQDTQDTQDGQDGQDAPGVQGSNTDLCVVCLEPCVNYSTKCTTEECQCGPIVMHQDCYRDWIRRHNECPMCRTPRISSRADGNPIEQMEPLYLPEIVTVIPDESEPFYRATRVTQVEHPSTRPPPSLSHPSSEQPTRTQRGRSMSSWTRQLWDCCVPTSM